MAPLSYTCNLPASKYWSLRVDLEWTHYVAQLDRNTIVVLENAEETDDGGDTLCTRKTLVSGDKNPIPENLRGFLGCKEFSFTLHERWWKDKFDEAHPYTYTTTPPVMADRIVVSGRAWAEVVSVRTCTLFFEQSVKVKVLGLGDKLAKGIESETAKSYAETARRAEKFWTEREAMRDAARIADPPMSQAKGWRWRDARRKLSALKMIRRTLVPFVRRQRRTKAGVIGPTTRTMMQVGEVIRQLSWQDAKEHTAAWEELAFSSSVGLTENKSMRKLRRLGGSSAKALSIGTAWAPDWRRRRWPPPPKRLPPPMANVPQPQVQTPPSRAPQPQKV